MSFTPLPRLPYHRLRFTLRSRHRCTLPAFKGSTLRGAFGHALRRSVCSMPPQQPCRRCSLRDACTYSRLFETFITGPTPPWLGGSLAAPRPFVLEPGTDRTAFAPGDPLSFDFLLCGRAAEWSPYALLAVERMGGWGLGAGRHPFDLHQAQSLGPDGSWTELHRSGGPGPRRLGPSPLCAETNGLPAERLTLRFTTPTRLQVGKRLLAELTPRALVFKMLRRHLELAHFYTDAEVDWDFEPLLAHAESLRIETQRLTWQPLTRYSNRQQQKLAIGGLVGEITLVGELTALHPLLRSAEIFHIGKGTTLGLGKVAVG